MTKARIITNEGVREVSDRELFTHAYSASRAQVSRAQAAWDAKVEWYVERILSGCVFSEYGNPAVGEAKKRIALREAAECGPDPLRHVEPKSRRAA
jgi:hypothetical protein